MMKRISIHAFAFSDPARSLPKRVNEESWGTGAVISGATSFLWSEPATPVARGRLEPSCVAHRPDVGRPFFGPPEASMSS